jgi:chromosome segregation protein
MYLKRLEMVGFKSFAERTRLEFEPGITSIVGPNGCGKSNVVDALRWCLGEMSAKSLRSKVLMDVVFNGSANRAPTNMAEVSLTFDNSQNRLPIDYSEVTITRRLFRSGESEYYMNKVQCRLKDIRELFLDTGIGEEGYSIMEQGRVEYILNAKPEERRELFEEAAGVSKYKARREETLRKMERTQIDLDRLADVIAMTKEQMDKIEAAVRKARQYQKLQEDLKNIEIGHWLREIQDLDQQTASLKQEVASLEDALQSKTTQIDQREADLAALRLSETELGEKLVTLNRELSDIDGQIGLAEQKETTAREREAEIRQRDEILDRELAQGTARRAELARLLEEVTAALETEQRALEDLSRSLESAQETHRGALERQKGHESRSAALQNGLWEKSQAQARLHNDIAAQRSKETHLDAELKQLQKDRVKAEEKIRSAETACIQDTQDLAARAAALSGLEEGVSRTKGSLDELETELASLSRDWSDAQGRFFQAGAEADALQKMAESDPYARGAQSLMKAGLPGLHGPLGRLITVAAGDETVARLALDGHLNDLVADTLADAQSAVDRLAASGDGRARVWVLERLHASDAAPASLPAGHRRLTDIVRSDPRFRPVLDVLLGRGIAAGATLYGEGVVEGGADQPAAGPDPLRAGELASLVQELTVTLDGLKSRREAAEASKPVLAAAWEEARRSLDTARVQHDFYRQESERRRTDLALSRDEVALIDKDAERLQAERSAAEETAQGMEKALEFSRAEEESLRREWQSLQERLQQAQAESSEAAASLAVARQKADGQQERFQWQEGRRTAAQDELGGLESGLASKRSERDSSGQRVEEQKRVQAEARQAVEQLLSRRRGTEKALEAVQSERLTLHDRITEAQTSLTQLREGAEEVRTALHEKKVQLTHGEFRRESTERQMQDKYSISAVDAQQVYAVPAEPVPAHDLERLRKRVESLGAVNLAAPEEHAQLEERYNFLLSQQQDLLKAKDDLMQTIQKINATTRQNFRETFDKVRENFKAIYGQLFQGGEADVRLTDEADLTNTGVEIFAQPPGKKLTNIALLSGGEKALTAVSLLFAFFMVRPAPFCVLDEVDAPLDEANVTRFITLLRAFTHQSQFLIITHNKRTMETADILYGVTMETLGVSRILSAKLKKGGTTETLRPEEVIAARTAGAEPAAS